MSQPLLSLCMIVRDSAATLPACLASIRPWVDELIVVDTGSVDDTREIAKRFGAQVFEFPWIDDFAAARNESLKHATGQWLFWMDSDDTIDEENGRQLRELAYGRHADHILGYVMQVHCPAPAIDSGDEMTVVDHVKLIRNHPEIRFEGRIHEQVIPAIRRLGGEVAWTDLFVVHSGAEHSPEAKQRKYERDLRILQKDLAERPNHPFVLFNLGMTYDDMGQYQEAENWLRQCLAVSDPRESHVRKAYALLASSLDRQGKPHEAHEVCRHGLKLFSEDKELLFRLGILEHRARNYEAAIRAFRAVLNHQGERHFTSVDRGITGYKARHNLALAYEDAGRLDLAELQWRDILQDEPAYQAAKDSLSRLLCRQAKTNTLAAFYGGKVISSQVEKRQHQNKIEVEMADCDSPAAATRQDLGEKTTDDAARGVLRGAEQSLAQIQQANEHPIEQLSYHWPDCHSRRVVSTDQGTLRLCAHPWVLSPDNVVSFSTCLNCELRTRPPPKTFRECITPSGRFRSGLCFHLGEEVGLQPCDGCHGTVNLKVFACRHLKHDVTTYRDCEHCPDFEPRLRKGTVRRWEIGIAYQSGDPSDIARCLASIKQAGWSCCHAAAPLGSEIPPVPMTVLTTQLDEHQGLLQSWRHLVDIQLRSSSDADAYFVVHERATLASTNRVDLENLLWPTPQTGLLCLDTTTHPDLPLVDFMPIGDADAASELLGVVFSPAAARALAFDEGDCMGDSASCSSQELATWAARHKLTAYIHHSPSTEIAAELVEG